MNWRTYDSIGDMLIGIGFGICMTGFGALLLTIAYVLLTGGVDCL